MILEPGITIVNEIDIPEARISLRSDGIVHVHFNKDTTLDIALQKRLRKHFDELVSGHKGKFIFSADEGFVLTKEAREFVPEPGDDSPVLCAALVVNNLAYKIIADFYVRVAKPNVNYKLVGSVSQAVKWLNAFKE